MGARPNRFYRTLAAVAGVLALMAPGASAAPVPGSSAPLPGSSVQGGDGNQDDQAPSVDWQALQTAGRVVHSADADAADTSFGGRSKEDEPGEWTLTTESGGVNPGKANVLDAWSSVDQSGMATFLYLAFTRAQANGDTFLAFELNQDARLWDNGRARIPCRRTGDVLVVAAASGNGISGRLERWTTSQADPATGCATRGSLTQVETLPVAAVQGAVNPGPITSRLPGAFPPSTTIADTGLFGEAALNLSVLMERAFGDACFGFGSIWMHSRSSTSESSSLQDYLAPQALAVRTCTASGTKFLDRNANGRFDPGEPGLPRFLVWADYDGDGARDAEEPFGVTDRRGHYVIYDIRPPGGSYTLRETLATAPGATSWICSFPNAGTPGGFGSRPGGTLACGWGPIVAADTPNAENKDFGNWLPARLTVGKRLLPSGDPGRFDLAVNGVTVVAAAGDRATRTIALRPGTYDITEQAVPPTDPSAYRSAVTCRTTPRRRGSLRPGRAWLGLVLGAGDQATCTFINVRPRAPGIAVEKVGPLLARAGTTLEYTLFVTNPGDVAFPAATVRVADPACDAPPALVGKADASGDDATPGTLDPGDSWTYGCSRQTPPPAAAGCRLSRVTNTVTATAGAAGVEVTDDDTIATTLLCPAQPPQPPLPTPTPPAPPGPSPAPNPTRVAGLAVLPAGPESPPAGRAAVAGIVVRGGCLSRVSQLRLVGTRMAGFSVAVDGRRVRRQTVEILRRTARPLTRVLAPGRHRVSVRIVFEPGSGAAPVTLSRTVTVCAGARGGPDFTG